MEDSGDRRKGLWAQIASVDSVYSGYSLLQIIQGLVNISPSMFNIL